MRRDRWLVALLSVAAGSALMAAGVCVSLSRWLTAPGPDGAPGPDVAAAVASPSPPTDPPAPAGDPRDAIVERSLFSSAPGRGGGGGGGGATGRFDAMLIVTAVAEDPAYSTALIELDGDATPAVYGEGDALADATVEHIERTRVTVVLPGGDREVLRLGERERGATPHKLKPATDKDARRDLRKEITRVDETHYEVPRDALEYALAHLGDMAKEAKVVPNFVDGQAAGFRLTKVKNKGLVSELGLRRNDVLTGVNGLPVEPAALIEGLDDLKQADQIRLQIERGGAPLVLEYEIQ